MIRKLGLLLMVATMAAGLCACSNTAATTADTADIAVDVQIKEKMFIAQTMDIYLNPDEYIGKTIQYEGMYFGGENGETGQTYSYVIRYGPGCCGYDENAGFEVRWTDGNHRLPDDNDWVEATGVLQWYQEGENRYLRLDLLSLKTMMKRGAETVLQ